MRDDDVRAACFAALGLSLCTIHHRADDENLIGVSPDRQVHVGRKLLDDDDGPMLDLLKGSHGVIIEVPMRASHQPDRAHLAIRFEQFQATA
jgi:putative restriction endonuclease